MEKEAILKKLAKVGHRKWEYLAESDGYYIISGNLYIGLRLPDSLASEDIDSPAWEHVAMRVKQFEDQMAKKEAEVALRS